MTRLTVITLLFVFSTIRLFAQSSASVSVSVTLIEPVVTQKLEDLRFGTFAMQKNPGTIEVRSTGLRSASGGVKLCADTAERCCFISHHQSSPGLFG
jgi:hypothetical protein